MVSQSIDPLRTKRGADGGAERGLGGALQGVSGSNGREQESTMNHDEEEGEQRRESEDGRGTTGNNLFLGGTARVRTVAEYVQASPNGTLFQDDRSLSGRPGGLSARRSEGSGGTVPYRRVRADRTIRTLGYGCIRYGTVSVLHNLPPGTKIPSSTTLRYQ